MNLKFTILKTNGETITVSGDNEKEILNLIKAFSEKTAPVKVKVKVKRETPENGEQKTGRYRPRGLRTPRWTTEEENAIIQGMAEKMTYRRMAKQFPALKNRSVKAICIRAYLLKERAKGVMNPNYASPTPARQLSFSEL